MPRCPVSFSLSLFPCNVRVYIYTSRFLDEERKRLRYLIVFGMEIDRGKMQAYQGVTRTVNAAHDPFTKDKIEHYAIPMT